MRYDDIYHVTTAKHLSFHIMLYRIFRHDANHTLYSTDQLINWIKMCYIGISIVIRTWNELYKEMRFWSYCPTVECYINFQLRITWLHLCQCACRRDVLDELVTLHNFSNQFLPNALRDFFRHIHAPEERGEYLETLITKFSHRFCTCNPGLVRDLGLSPGKYLHTF